MKGPEIAVGAALCGRPFSVCGDVPGVGDGAPERKTGNFRTLPLLEGGIFRKIPLTFPWVEGVF